MNSKRIFIASYENGKQPKVIFEENGFDTDIIGMERVKSSSRRWRIAYKKDGIDGLCDTRTLASGRSINNELSIEEKYARLQAQNNFLKAENELLKKNRYDGKEVVKGEVSLPAEHKFILIASIIQKYKLKNMVSCLCKIAGVSRSGYYNYFSLKSKTLREERNNADEKLRDIILKAYHFKGRKKGARQIKMTLAGHYKITYNLKRIRRIMKKYGIICPIRKANPYRRMMKATKKHRVLPNLLNRNFKQNIPGKVLLTDITYLFYGQGKKAYLSTIKDGSTNEILAYNVSDKLTVDISINTIHKLKKRLNTRNDT